MINRWWRALALFVLLLGVLGAALAVVVANADPGALGHAVIRVDGERVTLAEVSLHPLAMVIAGMVAALVALVVVPIAVCVPLLAVAFGLGIGLLAIAGTAALALSPLLLLGWIVWRVARPASGAR